MRRTYGRLSTGVANASKTLPRYNLVRTTHADRAWSGQPEEASRNRRVPCARAPARTVFLSLVSRAASKRWCRSHALLGAHAASASRRRLIAIGRCSLSRMGSSARSSCRLLGQRDDGGVEGAVRVVLPQLVAVGDPPVASPPAGSCTSAKRIGAIGRGQREGRLGWRAAPGPIGSRTAGRCRSRSGQ